MAQPENPRTLLSVTGADAEGFLQNLITQDIARAENLAYAALLSPQGKYLADFFVLKHGGGYLIDVATTTAPSLYQRLSMYKLRAAVTIEQSDLTVTCGMGDVPDGAWVDPRHPSMGWRAYGIADDGSTLDWARLRCEHLIPESNVELTPDTYILEAGFERLNGVDFKKGCYVGQEVTARMKHKTTLRKGLASVRVSGTAPVGTKIEKDGKDVGTLFTQSNGTGIAYLRFDRGDGPMTAGAATVERV